MEKELNIDKDNKFFDEYSKLIDVENKSLIDLLKKHAVFDLSEHLRLNFLLDCCLPNKADRILVEENSYEAVLAVDDLPESCYEFLEFKKFVSNKTRNKIREAQYKRTPETQQKMNSALKGQHRSEAVRKKFSEMRKGRTP